MTRNTSAPGVALLLAAAAVLLAACAIPDPAKDGSNDGPSCDSAFGNLYDQGCTLNVNGYPVMRGDAISGCEDDENDASDCGCDDERDDLLDCLDDLSLCSDCDTEFSNYSYCMSYC
jgi:hypothetical protein